MLIVKQIYIRGVLVACPSVFELSHRNKVTSIIVGSLPTSGVKCRYQEIPVIAAH